MGIIDYGKIIALDSPRKLVSTLDAESRVLFKVEEQDVAAAEFQRQPEVSRVETVEDEYIQYTRDANTTLHELVRLADRQGFRSEVGQSSHRLDVGIELNLANSWPLSFILNEAQPAGGSD